MKGGDIKMEKTLSEKIIEEWKSDPKLREEFITIGAYEGFRRAEEAGLIKICRAPVVK